MARLPLHEPALKAARHKGRMAVARHRIRKGYAPSCPHHEGSPAAQAWHIGVAEGQAIIDQLMELET